MILRTYSLCFFVFMTKIASYVALSYQAKASAELGIKTAHFKEIFKVIFHQIIDEKAFLQLATPLLKPNRCKQWKD